MPPWAPIVLVACAVAITVALVAAIVTGRRVLLRADAVLAIIEQELRPLVGRAHALTEELGTLTREATLEMKRIGEATERVNAAVESVGRVAHALAGLTRAGQVIGLAAGLKRGVDVFVQRFKR